MADPAAGAPFFGREVECDRLVALVRSSPVVTVIGVPGCGKTRLAAEVQARHAKEFAGGTFTVALAEVRDDDAVESVIAGALGIQEQPGRPLTSQLADRVTGRSMLLLLDNCEHMTDRVAPIVERLVAIEPGVRVLTTSQRPLRVAGEVTFTLPPLPLDAAVELFAWRCPTPMDHDDISAACERLGRLPMAIELAAALGSVDAPAGVTGSDPLARTVAASLDRLDEDGRRALALLTAWPAGCASDVTAAFDAHEGVERLLDASLATADQQRAATRYVVPEPVRALVTELLDPALRAQADEALTTWAAELADDAASGLVGADQARWAARLDAEAANLRAALGALLHVDDGERASRLAANLVSYWVLRGQLSEGVLWLERAVRAPGAVIAATARLGILYQAQGRLAEAELSYQAAVDAARAADDEDLAAAALAGLGQVALITGRIADAARLLDEAHEAAERSGDQETLLTATHARATLARVTGDYEQALTYTEAELALARALGNRKALALGLLQQGGVAQLQARRDDARRHLEESLAAAREIGFTAVLASALGNLGSMAGEDGEYARAAELLTESLDVTRASGDVRITMITAFNLAETLVLAGDVDAARPLYGEAHAIARRLGDRRAIAFGLKALGDLWLADGNVDRAAALYHEAGRTRRSIGDKRGLALTVESAAAIAVARAEFEEAMTLLGGADALRRAIGLPHEPADQRKVEELLNAARVALTAEQAASAHEAGLALPFDAAVTQALDTLGEPELERVSPVTAPAAAGIAVRTLGAFDVVVDGERVAANRWQSKRARDLLKLLIVHRGHPVPRDVLIDALWPEPGDVGLDSLRRRLSVALSTLRSVLEPERASGDTRSPIVADAGSIALDLSVVDVDVERFLAHATAGRLAPALAAYGGEFLPDDIYADWTIALREEARLAYVGVAHALAQEAALGGDHAATVEFCVRVLEADPYDDAGHRMLIAALASDGRHGAARSSYERFVALMDDLGLAAPTFAELTGAPSSM